MKAILFEKFVHFTLNNSVTLEKTDEIK